MQSKRQELTDMAMGMAMPVRRREAVQSVLVSSYLLFSLSSGCKPKAKKALQLWRF